jgi:UDP-galactose transporter B1
MCSAIGQVFIFLTIAKFGALTCSLMSLTRKVTTLTASIVIYDHELATVQIVGLAVSLGAMMLNFVRPKEPKKEADYAALTNPPANVDEEQPPGELHAMIGSSKH